MQRSRCRRALGSSAIREGEITFTVDLDNASPPQNPAVRSAGPLPATNVAPFALHECSGINVHGEYCTRQSVPNADAWPISFNAESCGTAILIGGREIPERVCSDQGTRQGIQENVTLISLAIFNRSMVSACVASTTTRSTRSARYG